MMGKKNLEQLFKEVFRDFNETPDEKIWNSIEASLDKKERKKRVIPIWWRLGGIAALLAVLFYVINPFDSSNEKDDIQVTEINKDNTSANPDNELKESKKSETFTTSETEQIVESSNESESEPINTDDADIKAKDSMIKYQKIESEQQLANNPKQQSKEGEVNNSTSQINELDLINNADEEVAAVNNEGQSKIQEVEEDIIVSESEVASIANKNLEKETNDKLPSENDIQKEELQQKENLFEIPVNTDAVVENNIDKRKTVEESNSNDEESNNTPEKKSIFEVIEEQEEKALAENTSQKWSVGPSVAPVYFSATGNGSPIHSNFAANSKSGNVNLSYGLTVAYDLGKKLKVRSGVHKVNFGYDTNDVVFSASLDASANDMIDNIDYSQTARTVIVQSKNSVPEALANDTSLELAANENPSLDGKMVQQLGYIEVPLELDYALIDKKFGVNLIGGVSSLFLVDNSVLLESDDLVTEVGEANNANTVNFSTNVGVGLNYEFSSKVQLNLEPVLKYQLNTFSETAGSFRPFSVGVYSGVRFKF